MLTVEGLIGDLLIQHNCVVVPGFGGFVAQRVAAQLDTAKGRKLDNPEEIPDQRRSAVGAI